jgi:hypothetical protein
VNRFFSTSSLYNGGEQPEDDNATAVLAGQRCRVVCPYGVPLRSQGGVEEWDRFDHTITTLSKEIIQLCFHAVAHPDDDEPYTVLKEDLLQQHSLTKCQRIERLLSVGPLGSRRPSQLLAEMMELCHDDEEASCFFVFFFLQLLPAGCAYS